MGRLLAKLATSKSLVIVSAISATLVLAPYGPSVVHADQLIPRSLTSSNSFAGATNVNYFAIFTIASNATVGSVTVMFCDNTPLADEPCNPPAGFNASSVALGQQGGAVGFSVSPSSTANAVVLSRPPLLVTAATPVFYELTKIQNPTSGGPLFARFYTYPTSDGSGPYTDYGGMALYIHQAVDITAEVPPYLTFCLGESISGLDCSTATEPFSDMGNFSSKLTSAAQHQVLIATNAPDGYSMWATGSSMTSGGNVLTPMAGGPSVKGTSQFGINLRANTVPVVGQDPIGPGGSTIAAGYNTPNQFRFNSGDTLVTAPAPDDYRKYTISYIVNIPVGQPGGVYSATLTYVCLANF